MPDILRRTTVAMLLLLVMPVLVLLFGWQWQPGETGTPSLILFWFTETVTRPWGILTSAILCGWFLWCLRFRLKPALFLLVIMIAAIMVGQYAKSLIKDRVQEPRPYVVWLEKEAGISNDYFYDLKRKQRSRLVEQTVADNPLLPDWLKRHWAFETGFSFPSGHTMFAASWALLGVGLLWPRRHYVTIALLLFWASMVMGSRLVLGMHWPRDVIVSTLLSWLFITVATWLAQRFCGPLSVPPEEAQEIDSRENRTRRL